jgi:TolB protein
MVALAGTVREAEATFPGTNARIAFDSERTTGTGVDNPTGDSEIFTIKPDGTGLKQLTHNTVDDSSPVFSPDGTKIAYESRDTDYEIYLMTAADGSGQTNLTNNYVDDFYPVFSPDGQKVAYASRGVQNSNPEGDFEVYSMNASDGSSQTNLTNNGAGVVDLDPDFSPSGQKIAYRSEGIQQASNPQGDKEVYVMSALDGSGQTNLTNNGTGVNDDYPVFSPGGTKIAYQSSGTQASNLQGEGEVYVMSALDGAGKKNLTNNGSSVDDDAPSFSPDGTKVAYDSEGIQTSNPQGDTEIYRMSALDGAGKKNLTNNGGGVYDYTPFFSPDGKKIVHESEGAQTSNSQGDQEIYVLNTLDGSSKKNLTNNAEYDETPDWGRQAM